MPWDWKRILSPGIIIKDSTSREVRVFNKMSGSSSENTSSVESLRNLMPQYYEKR
jgi:hypothetical protein